MKAEVQQTLSPCVIVKYKLITLALHCKMKRSDNTLPRILNFLNILMAIKTEMQLMDWLDSLALSLVSNSLVTRASEN